MTLNDAILAATGGPTINDGLRAFFLSQIGEGDTGQSLNDLERAWLMQDGPATPGDNTADLWMGFLGDEGFTQGTIQDRMAQWWESIIQ